MKLVIENKQEEQLMILMVAQNYQHINYTIISYTEQLAKSLYNIYFDAYDIATKIEDDSIFEYIDETWTYEKMLKEGAVKIFREVLENGQE